MVHSYENGKLRWNSTKDFEDVAVLLFDCDKDGDLDLFLGPGGNNAEPNTREIQFRLFKNDGTGNFEIDTEAFPKNEFNIAVAVTNDFDHDGDLDLFVGSRSVPRDYGLTPASYLFVNDGNGHFQDMAKEKNPDIAALGMVTGAVWTDVAGDKDDELVVVGEWMAPRIFSFSGDRFTEIKTNLLGMSGWWQTVSVADINNDGKNDLILGNIGENFYLAPTKESPVKLWINDFDQNGIKDKVLTRTVDGKDKTVFSKTKCRTRFQALKNKA